MLFMYFKYIFVYGIHMCYKLFKTLALETPSSEYDFWQ